MVNGQIPKRSLYLENKDMIATNRVLNIVGIILLVMAASVVSADGNSRWIQLSEKTTSNSGKVVTTGEEDAGTSLTVEFPGIAVDVIEGNSRIYSQLRIPGCGATASAVGSPELPFKGFFVEIPAGANVTCEYEGKSESLGMEWRVYPQQQPMADNSDEEPVFTIDREVYEKDVFLPEEQVLISEPGVIRGRHVVFVQVFPVQYNPATTELRATSSVSLTLHFDRVGTIDDQLRKTELATIDSEKLAERLIVNYRPVDLTKKQYSKTRSDQGADYLVIAADSLVDAVQPLAEWKRKKGFVTQVVPMSEVGSTAAELKSYIQTAYDTWTPTPSFVLLVGDNRDVPPRYYSGYKSCVSDYPYSCVDGTDIYADLTIGRLPVSTVIDCENVVSKILTYERNPDTGDWYDDFLAAAYFQDSNDNNGYADRWFMETAMTSYKFFTTQLGWDGHTALCTSYSPTSHSTWRFRSDSYPHRESISQTHWGVTPYPNPVPQWIVDLWTSHSQATSDISTAINAGVGIVQHRDHGGETSWGDPPYGISNISALNNGSRTPVVFSTNCLTGSFHRYGGDCFCEAFLKKYPGGCVGIVGATRTSYSGPNDVLVHGTYTGMWPEYDPTYTQTRYPNTWRPAEALNFGKYYMSFYCGLGGVVPGEFHMFHWFGDPEMSLRTDTPATLSVTHPQWGTVDQPMEVIIGVEQDGSPVGGAIVCISHNTPGQYWTGTTNVLGMVTFTNITFSERDDYDVVVTAHNAIPYEGIIDTSVSSQGYVNLNQKLYSCGAEITVQLGDFDLMGNGVQDVTFFSSGGDRETVTLAEAGSASGLFFGTLVTSEGIATPADGELQLEHGDLITVNYYDLDTGTGNPGVANDQASADCAAPIISNISSEIRGLSALVGFNTDTTACASVMYGIDCSDLENTTVESCATEEHNLVLTSLMGKTQYYFAVYAEDELGNGFLDDNDGQCYSFTTPEIYFYDDFPESSLNSITWPVTSGNPRIVEDDVAGQPSEPYSLLLESGGMVESFPIDLSGACGTVLRFRHRALNDFVYWQSGTGLTYKSVNGGEWLEIPQCSILDAPRDNYGEIAVILPVDAYHADFQFRLQNTIDYGNGGWFIDNVIVEPAEVFDCNENGVGDACDISIGASVDCQFDFIPDECQLAGNDCSNNGIPDECEPDCNANGVTDECDITGGTSSDCNTNGIPDECEEMILHQKIFASDASPDLRFGGCVSVDGNVAIVSAPAADAGVTGAGAAYVFRYQNGNWGEEARLVASDPSFGANFGQSVSISGDVALVGARLDSQLGEYAGAAYIFRNGPNGWQQEAKLLASDGYKHDYFGYEVALDGEVAIIGSYFANAAGTDSGAAYIFRYNGSSWIEETKLVGSDVSSYDKFGVRVAIDGEVAVVGAYNDDPIGANSGAAYVFRYDGSTWTEEAKLTASLRDANDYFGRGVAVNGHLITVGAYGENNETGAAYVFRYDGSAWVREARFAPSDGGAGDRYGHDVACYENLLVAGTLYGGSAYLYEYDGVQWLLKEKLSDPQGTTDSGYGAAVDIYSQRLFVGAYLDSEKGSEAGAAHLVNLSGNDCNENGVLDECDITIGTSIDCDNNGIPDDCQADCNDNGIADECELQFGTSHDCNLNAILDECDIANGKSDDCNSNGIPDDCEPDCNVNGMTDECDIASGTADDCNTNGIPDECEFDLGWSTTRIEASNVEEGASFGEDISLDGKTAIVSAYLEDSIGENTGAAYVFSYEKNNWHQVTSLTPSGIISGGQFGSSCFVKGNLAIVGAPYDNQVADLSGAAYIFRKDTTGWQKEAKFVAGDADYRDFFGQVAIDGDVALVGAYGADLQMGAAYVYRYDGSAWVQEAKLTSGSSSYRPRFGRNVALEGNIAVVGAYNDDVQGTDSGAVYVFRFNGSSWARIARLIGSGTAAESCFGHRVLIDGDMIIVGSYKENGNTGAAYVFRRNGWMWVEEARLVPEDAVAGDNIGFDIACYGNQIAVGAIGAGVVYLYEYTGTEWQLRDTFVEPPNNIVANSHFGSSVALDSETLLVGARLYSGSAIQAGAAYIFTHRTNDCNANGVLDECEISGGTSEDCNTNGIPDECEQDCNTNGFADECDISEGSSSDCNTNGIPDECEIASGDSKDCNTNGILDECDIAIGASIDCDTNGIPDECQADCNDNGIADECDILFGTSYDCNVNVIPDQCDIASGKSNDCNTNAIPDECEFELPWLTTRVEASNIEQGAYFGGEVSLDGKTAIVSAHLEDSVGEDTGAVYVLSYEKSNWQQVARLAPSGITSGGKFGSSCFVKGNLAIVSAPFDGQDEEHSGAAYIFRRDAAGAWQQEARLVAGDTGYHEYFGKVAIDGDVAIVGVYLADSQLVAAYVYRYNGSAWVQEAKLDSGSSGFYPWFGMNVALEGNIAVVGASRDDVQGTDSGAVYVFRFNGSSWVSEATLIGSGITNESYFGHGLSINGDMITVGSYGENNETGAGYVFRYNGTAWVEEARLVPEDAVAGDNIGCDIACYGNQVAVGAVGAEAVYLYEYTGTEWRLRDTLVDPADNISSNSQFGAGLAFDSGTLLVGASLDSGSANQAGAAYIFAHRSNDCNANGVLDKCDIAGGTSKDCNTNGIPDECGQDCNTNGVADECDISEGSSSDCNTNGIPDECEIASGDSKDCNTNGVLDKYDIAFGTSIDCDTNGIPDECQADCNDNGIPDECDLQYGTSYDCNVNAIPDECDIASGTSDDCNPNGIPDECELGFVWSTTRVEALNVEEGASFGADVLLDGKTAIVSAHLEDSAGEDTGAVYVFSYEKNNWRKVTRLTPSGITSGGRFGSSCFLKGNLAIVGAPFDSQEAEYSGAAYIFRKDVTGWQQEAKLVASDADYHDYFGQVAIDGDVAIVGAYFANNSQTGGSQWGAAYVYRYDGSAWIQEDKLVPDVGSFRPKFGIRVALEGDVAVVGAYGDDGQGIDSGAAYVFQYNRYGWRSKAKLIGSGISSESYFGYGLSINGDLITVGSYGENNETGAAYVFRYNGTTWVEEARLVPEDAVAGDRIGYDTVCYGNQVAVSSYTSDKVYLYEYTGTEWQLRDTFVDLVDDIAGNSRFGYSVALDSGTLVVGAYLNSESASEAGAAYIFNYMNNDCNTNGVLDECDIVSGVARDCNENSILDFCEDAQLGDFDGDCEVNLADFAVFTECNTQGPGVEPYPGLPVTSEKCLSFFDFDGDSDVDLLDFARLQEVFDSNP